MDSVRFDPQNALTRDGGSRAEINNAETNEPEHAADIAERVLDDLAARQATALDRLRRAHTTSPIYRKDKP